jgi:hypothetical protein
MQEAKLHYENSAPLGGNPTHHMCSGDAGTDALQPYKEAERGYPDPASLDRIGGVLSCLISQPLRRGFLRNGGDAVGTKPAFVVRIGLAPYAGSWQMEREVVVAITDGRLDFGPWEQIFYGEFDGGRRKRVLVKIVGE